LLTCAYCDNQCQPTREHVIPRWYNDTPGQAETFSVRAPLTHFKGDIVVKDVCESCNNRRLGDLDAYGKELYERYFAFTVYAGETVRFEYDGSKLLRWLLKLSYNSARAQNADKTVLHNYRRAILGQIPIPDRFRCWLHLVTATWFDPATNELRQARRDERGHPNVDEPLWFRIGQFRLPQLPAIHLVQRTVLINSFAFTLLVAGTELANPTSEIILWADEFGRTIPEAKAILPRGETLELPAGGDHTARSIYWLYSHHPSRFRVDSQASRKVTPNDGTSVVVLHITRDMIESQDIYPVAAALHNMVSSRENAASFRQRVTLAVDGFNDDPKDLWEIPSARDFFRRLFGACPFVMFVSHPDGSLLKLFAACWTHKEPYEEDAHRLRMHDFLTRAFHGLNRLNHTLALSEEQNREICIAAQRALFGNEEE
jgi:hypothetical protein